MGGAGWVALRKNLKMRKTRGARTEIASRLSRPLLVCVVDSASTCASTAANVPATVSARSTVSTKGDASCTITEGDLLPLDAKFYNFSVREVKSDNSREITYADTGYAAAGTVELLDGAYPEFVASTSVSSFTASGGPLTYTSGSIDSKPGINNNKALHTIAVYTKNFSGALRVQGTMSASPSNTDYFDITMEGAGSTANSFTDSTTVTNFNFTGVYHSVRFSWGNDSDNTGVIDKILYRQ